MELERLLQELKMDHLELQLDAVCEQAAERGLDYKSFLIEALNTEWQARHLKGIESRLRQARVPWAKTLDQFDIPHKAIILAKSDHVLWKKRLTQLLLGRTEMPSTEVTDHHSCRFGKWYYSTGRALYGAFPEFAAIEEPHRRVHETAKQVVRLHESGDTSGAQQLLEELNEPTREVLEGLDKLKKRALEAGAG